MNARIALEMLHNWEHTPDEDLTEALINAGYTPAAAARLTAQRGRFEGHAIPQAEALAMVRQIADNSQ